MTADRLLQVYAWHGRHHVAHITALRETGTILEAWPVGPSRLSEGWRVF